MASCDEPKLQAIEAALARMRAAIAPISDSETVSIDQALDRVLFEELRAPLDVPAYDNSAMDGYALRSEDAQVGRRLALIGSALAGHPFSGELQSGQCLRITTGAPIPAGADCVVMQENTSRAGDEIVINQAATAGEHIRRRGEDLPRGAAVLSRGHRLGPVDIGLLASLGLAEVKVYRRLRVAVLSTGDELVAPGQPLPEGHIYDSNRYALIAMLRRLNVEVIDYGLLPDQPQDIASALAQASEEADAIVSSGGVSVGDADYVKDVLGELGDIGFWTVAIRPGKPFAFGSIGASRFFGLPGNPVSSVVTLHQLAMPILQLMAGETIEETPRLSMQLADACHKRPGRAEYQRGRFGLEDGINRVHSTGAQGSGLLSSFSGANCYVVLERERGAVEAGEVVTVIPFDRNIR